MWKIGTQRHLPASITGRRVKKQIRISFPSLEDRGAKPLTLFARARSGYANCFLAQPAERMVEERGPTLARLSILTDLKAL